MQEDLSRYQLVIAPELYMVKPGVKDSLEQFVRNGGTLVLSLYCGITNENDQVVCGRYPEELRELAGIWTEEFDALKDRENSFVWKGTEYPARFAFAISHCEKAENLAEYQREFYACRDAGADPQCVWERNRLLCGNPIKCGVLRGFHEGDL